MGINNQDTLVSFILDETGSMSGIKQATISGFNEYVNSLRGNKIWMTLTKFNSGKIELVYESKPIADVPELSEETYKPDMNTPLYDAIGQTIKKLEKETDKKVLMVIMTDGEENWSREYSQKQIFDLIRRKTEQGWVFTFLGANQDSWATGASLGITQANAVNFKPNERSVQSAFHVMAAATAAFTAGASGTSMFNTRNVEDYEFQADVSQRKDDSVVIPEGQTVKFNAEDNSKA